MRARQNLSRAISIVVAIVTFSLVAFHISLLWHRLLDASIAQPGVIARWIAGALLVAGMFAARRQAKHRLMVLWLLVALLHAGLPADRQPAGTMPIAVVVQIGLTAVCSVLLTVVAAATPAHTSTARRLDVVDFSHVAAIATASLSGRSPPAI